MTSVTIRPGDLYCPRCLDGSLLMNCQSGGAVEWECEGCGQEFKHPFTSDHNGRFTWVWGQEKYLQPNAGCPWCGTCNIFYSPPRHGLAGQWYCLRQSCLKVWRGEFTVYDYRPTGGLRYFRWKIRVPVSAVPYREVVSDDDGCGDSGCDCYDAV